MLRPPNLPISGTYTLSTTATGVTVPPEIWAQMQHLLAQFGPLALNSLPSLIPSIGCFPCFTRSQQPHPPFGSIPPLPDLNDLGPDFLPAVNNLVLEDPATLPRFEPIPDEVEANGDDGNSHHSVGPLAAIQDNAPTGTQLPNMIMHVNGYNYTCGGPLDPPPCGPVLLDG
ncbi:hypothetical protein Pst134EA_030518 [Puccinia striiformis f. sp. tritici]|uniref:hypothetical protein n=1 Tax=Puccinia striiformis f. sp. tritici TaxID=168172 RepID=UPI002007DDF9|nr:hypothetical protein Pst134EA_030518 [Puccinia striiformis f. sp. tritici]KAH9446607.1 hypothetical protein Pst134EA_030518 [Puccinia striiformis f. sp. tritici]